MKKHRHEHKKSQPAGPQIFYSRALAHMDPKLFDPQGPDLLAVETDEEGKLSLAMVEMAQPVLDQAADLESSESILRVAVEIWNMLVLPEAEQQKLLVELADVMGLENTTLEVRNAVWADFDAMIIRREQLFGGDRRAIIAFSLYQAEGEVRFRVSALALYPAL